MANRDYFTRPNQGNGRDHHGYGHGVGPITGERREPILPGWAWISAAAIALYFLWQFTR